MKLSKTRTGIRYQGNIHYLEELQAQIGLAVRVDLFNELKWTREKIDNTLTELKNNLKQEITEEWQVEEPPFFSTVDTMSSEEILKVCSSIVQKKYEKIYFGIIVY